MPRAQFLLEMGNALKVQGLRSKVLLFIPDLTPSVVLSYWEMEDGRSYVTSSGLPQYVS